LGGGFHPFQGAQEEEGPFFPKTQWERFKPPLPRAQKSPKREEKISQKGGPPPQNPEKDPHTSAPFKNGALEKRGKTNRGVPNSGHPLGGTQTLPIWKGV